MALHKNALVGDIHIVNQWVYASYAAMTGATGFVSSDVGKIAWQTSDNTLWMLTAITPTWVPVGAGIPTFADILFDKPTLVTGSWGTTGIKDSNSQRHGFYTEQASGGVAGAINDKLSVKFMLMQGTYTMYVLGINNTSAAIDKWQLDGTDIVTGEDWYTSGTTFNVEKTYAGIVVPSSGVHTLSMVVTGKNASSSGFAARFTRVAFR